MRTRRKAVKQGGSEGRQAVEGGSGVTGDILEGGRVVEGGWWWEVVWREAVGEKCSWMQ